MCPPVYNEGPAFFIHRHEGRPVVGKVVSHYRITGKLGVGGMGVVYDAEDERLPRRVALKFLADELATDPDATRRLRREASMLARLNHPNICTIYEIDEHDGRSFIAMERLEGTNLKLHIARKVLDTPEVVDIATQVTEALDVAHDAGVVHRDIKPGNIFIGSNGQVKVLDFGMARSFDADDSKGSDGSTIPGRPIGTANYMAPERILQMPLDARCDFFSLGVVIYEMATGRLPFAGASPSETVANILDEQPVPLTKLAPKHPAALHQLFARLTAKRADERYQSARDVIDALSALNDRSRPGWRSRIRERFFPAE
jgi:serine/threonine protein kinase